MKKILLLGLLLGVSVAHAQNILVFGKGATDKISVMPAVIKDSVRIDTSVALVRYRFTKTDIHKDGEGTWCDILLQIGKNVAKQTDLRYYYGNLIYSNPARKERIAASFDAAGNTAGTNIFAEITTDLSSNEMVVCCGDFFYVNRMKAYTQSIPAIQWEIKESDTKEILGYRCREAVAKFQGRTWHVWFTTDIPGSFGPWKLWGLPGLIMAATDGKDYSFDCVGISNTEQPIYKYVYTSLQDIKTLKNYLLYERHSHEHPFQTFANGEEAIIMTTGADGKAIRLDESWTIPYNPIELE